MTAFNTRDKTIRKALIRTFDKNIGSVIVPEFPLKGGTVRVDVAVISDCMHGYELKGDLDNLSRLEHQSKVYSEVFDKVTLVVGKKHILEALKIIPIWWGITVAKSKHNSTVTLIPIREAQINPQRNTYSIASMLCKAEAIQLARDVMKAKKLSNKNKKYICNYLADNIETTQLRENVRTRLFYRYFAYV